MKKTIILLNFVLCVCLIQGQIRTTFFQNGNALNQIKHSVEKYKVSKIMQFSPFDVQKFIDEDKQNRGLDIPFRFGKAFDTNISISDGEWQPMENGRLWSMEFQSKGAYSINFVFDNFYLPDSAELYITNKVGTMLYGPVNYKQNTKSGYFLTDLIGSDDVIIYIFEPEDKKGKTQLNIKRVVHAYRNLFSNMSYGNLGGSESCNNDIACFPDWDKESDAVALVLLSSGTEWCSGSLLMTANSSFSPYFLSAFHCIDSSEDGNLSATEISNAENWMFKFQYKMTTCGGNSATTGITYNGAKFRSGWNVSDFLLMEMDNSPIGNTEFSWLGWDRTGATPTSGSCIHHPAGDVMKISFEENQFQTSTWGAVNNHWLVNFDDGVVQKGSSGSPILDQNKRVVGQLHGNQNYNPYLSFCSQPRAEYGRFDVSWTGGGTNTTRLCNWLDPAGIGSVTTNTSYPTISGPSQVCNQGTFTINLTTADSIKWSSDTPSTFKVLSGNGTDSATFYINFRLFLPTKAKVIATIVLGCQTITLTKDVQLGTATPEYSIYQLIDGVPSTTVAGITGVQYFFQIDNVPLSPENNNYHWTITPPPNIPNVDPQFTTIDTGQLISYMGRIPGTYTILLEYNGECGWCVESIQTFNLSGEIINLTLSLYPNPATDMLNVSLTGQNEKSASTSLCATNVNVEPYTIELWNERSSLVKTIDGNKSNIQISLLSLPKGMYFLHLKMKGKAVQKKPFWVQ